MHTISSYFFAFAPPPSPLTSSSHLPLSQPQSHSHNPLFHSHSPTFSKVGVLIPFLPSFLIDHAPLVYSHSSKDKDDTACVSWPLPDAAGSSHALSLPLRKNRHLSVPWMQPAPSCLSVFTLAFLSAWNTPHTCTRTHIHTRTLSLANYTYHQCHWLLRSIL